MSSSFRVFQGAVLALFITPFVEAQPRITSRSCPYSCRTEGIPREMCRDWREGESCFIEDLRSSPPAMRPSAPGFDPEARGAIRGGVCNEIERREIRRPEIEIGDLDRRGGFFEGKYRVRGSVAGQCLSEAGYFEDGRKVKDIPVAADTSYRRFEFEVPAQVGRNAEIRVYNQFGERDVYPLDDAISGRDEPPRAAERPSIVDELIGR